MTKLEFRYFLGIDGGGSGCRALLADRNGKLLAQSHGDAANIGAHTDDALRNIEHVVLRALKDAGLPISVLKELRAVLGLAGANSLIDKESVIRSFPFAQTTLLSDTETALQGGLGDGDGGLVILGTGSAFVGRKDNAIQVIGGRGFMLSDHAGGARLGRDALERTLLAADKMAEHSLLTETIYAQFDKDIKQIISFSRSATAADYAKYAPIVFDFEKNGDVNAESILKDACKFIETGLQTIDVQKLGRFTITGGLASSYAKLAYFPLRQFYVPAQGDSLQGALALALKQR